MIARTTLVATAMLAAAACSEDTGILVEVHGDELQVDVERLETMVIVDAGGGTRPTDLEWAAADRVEATGVSDWPYTVMLRPEGVPNDSTLWVSALAYGADDVLVGWGELDIPIAFEPDLVKRVELHLHPAQLNDAGCVVKDGIVVVRGSDDCDGDQVPYTEDCDDLDPTVVLDVDGDPVVCFGDCDPTDPLVYPGAPESCNGVDDDCDPESLPDPQFCATVVREGDVIVDCRLGQQVCNDGPIDPGYGPCVAAPIDADVNAEVCSRWEACNAGGVEPTCFLDVGVRCAVPVDKDSGRACVPAIEPMHELASLVDCTWQLIGNVQQGSWNLGLRPEGSTQSPGTFVDICAAELVVTAVDVDPRLVVMQANGDVESVLIGVVLAPELVSCDPDAPPFELACEVVFP